MEKPDHHLYVVKVFVHIEADKNKKIIKKQGKSENCIDKSLDSLIINNILYKRIYKSIEINNSPYICNYYEEMPNIPMIYHNNL